MVRKTKLIDIWLRKIILRIQEIASKFHNLNYFHVLQINNSKADKSSNRAVGLEPSILLINEDKTGWDPLL